MINSLPTACNKTIQTAAAATHGTMRLLCALLRSFEINRCATSSVWCYAETPRHFTTHNRLAEVHSFVVSVNLCVDRSPQAKNNIKTFFENTFFLMETWCRRRFKKVNSPDQYMIFSLKHIGESLLHLTNPNQIG